MIDLLYSHRKLAQLFPEYFEKYIGLDSWSILLPLSLQYNQNSCTTMLSMVIRNASIKPVVEESNMIILEPSAATCYREYIVHFLMTIRAFLHY